MVAVCQRHEVVFHKNAAELMKLGRTLSSRMGEKAFTDTMCSSCTRITQEMEATKREQAMTLKMIREKIISTDKLIRKYQRKCDDVDEKLREIAELNRKLDASQRNEEVLQAQLDQSLQSANPLNKNNKRLIQEKFTAEAKIEELRQENAKQENLVNDLRRLLFSKEEKECSLLLGKQVQAQEIQSDKKKIEKLTDELKKAKQDCKKEKGLAREKTRELRASNRKNVKTELQIKTLKDEVKFLKRELKQSTGKVIRMTNSMSHEQGSEKVIKPRPRAKRSKAPAVQSTSSTLQFQIPELSDLSQSDDEEMKTKTAAGILDEFSLLTQFPVLSPLPVSPLDVDEDGESYYSSSDEESVNESESEGGSDVSSIGDLGQLLELELQQKGDTEIHNLENAIQSTCKEEREGPLVASDLQKSTEEQHRQIKNKDSKNENQTQPIFLADENNMKPLDSSSSNGIKTQSAILEDGNQIEPEQSLVASNPGKSIKGQQRNNKNEGSKDDTQTQPKFLDDGNQMEHEESIPASDLGESVKGQQGPENEKDSNDETQTQPTLLDDGNIMEHEESLTASDLGESVKGQQGPENEKDSNDETQTQPTLLDDENIMEHEESLVASDLGDSVRGQQGPENLKNSKDESPTQSTEQEGTLDSNYNDEIYEVQSTLSEDESKMEQSGSLVASDLGESMKDQPVQNEKDSNDNNQTFTVVEDGNQLEHEGPLDSNCNHELITQSKIVEPSAKKQIQQNESKADTDKVEITRGLLCLGHQDLLSSEATTHSTDDLDRKQLLDTDNDDLVGNTDIVGNRIRSVESKIIEDKFEIGKRLDAKPKPKSKIRSRATTQRKTVVLCEEAVDKFGSECRLSDDDEDVSLPCSSSDKPSLTTAEGNDLTVVTPTSSDKPSLTTTERSELTVVTPCSSSDKPSLTLAERNDLTVVTATSSDKPPLTTTECSELTVVTPCSSSDKPSLTLAEHNDLTVVTATSSDKPSLTTTECNDLTVVRPTSSDKPSLTTMECNDLTVVTPTSSDKPSLTTTECNDLTVVTATSSDNPSLTTAECNDLTVVTATSSDKPPITTTERNDLTVVTPTSSDKPSLTTMECSELTVVTLNDENRESDMDTMATKNQFPRKERKKKTQTCVDDERSKMVRTPSRNTCLTVPSSDTPVHMTRSKSKSLGKGLNNSSNKSHEPVPKKHSPTRSGKTKPPMATMIDNRVTKTALEGDTNKDTNEAMDTIAAKEDKCPEDTTLTSSELTCDAPSNFITQSRDESIIPVVRLNNTPQSQRPSLSRDDSETIVQPKENTKVSMDSLPSTSSDFRKTSSIPLKAKPQSSTEFLGLLACDHSKVTNSQDKSDEFDLSVISPNDITGSSPTEMTVCEEGNSTSLEGIAECTELTPRDDFTSDNQDICRVEPLGLKSCDEANTSSEKHKNVLNRQQEVQTNVLNTFDEPCMSRDKPISHPNISSSRGPIERKSLVRSISKSTRQVCTSNVLTVVLPPISVVLDDEYCIFDDLSPVLSPLPPSPIPSPPLSPLSPLSPSRTSDRLTTSPSHLAPPPFTHPACKSKGQMKRNSENTGNTDSPRKKQKSEECSNLVSSSVDVKPNLVSSSVDVEPKTNDDQPVQIKKAKKQRNTLTTRPALMSEKNYSKKIIKRLYANDIHMDEIVKRLGDVRGISNGLPFALAVREFGFHKDFMPQIIQKYSERSRIAADKAISDDPLMPSFEWRVAKLIGLLTPYPHLHNLSTTTINLLSIIAPGAGGSMEDKRVLASNCRLVTALCRQVNNLSHVRVLCFNILRSLHISIGTKIYLMTSIAGVWPAVFSPPSSPWLVKQGTLQLSGPPFYPLCVTVQVIISGWVRENNWVLLGNIMDWMCGWTPLPTLTSPLKQLTSELTRLMTDSSIACLVKDEYGHPVLDFGIFEIIKSLELVAFVQGWEWINNVLIRDVIWGILRTWKTETHQHEQSRYHCTDGNEMECKSRAGERSGEVREPTGATIASLQSRVDGLGEAVVVAAIRLLGMVCRLAIQQGQPAVPHVQGVLMNLLTPRNISVPYAVQLATAYSLIEVSPWQPQQISQVLEKWRTSQQVERALPSSIVQTLDCMKLALGS